MMMAASVPPRPETDPASVPPVPWERIDRFIGQWTHDIRNGLNALELQLTLLGELSTDSEVAAEVKALRSTLFDVTRQLQAVKASSGPVAPHRLCYPAADFFEDLRDRFQRLHSAAAGRLTWKIAVADASLDIDPELSLSALLELLTNALRFAEANTGIGFQADVQKDGGVTVILRESQPQPPAVPPEDWGRTPLLTTQRNAYGLGLFRVRRIIAAQGGDLHAEYSATERVLATTISFPGAHSRGV